MFARNSHPCISTTVDTSYCSTVEFLLWDFWQCNLPVMLLVLQALCMSVVMEFEVNIWKVLAEVVEGHVESWVKRIAVARNS